MTAWRRALALLLVASPAAAQQSLGPPAPTNSEPPPVQQNVVPPPKQGFSFNPDAGVVYQSGDFRVTAWGYAERANDPDGPDYFRHVRQGAEIDSRVCRIVCAQRWSMRSI